MEAKWLFMMTGAEGCLMLFGRALPLTVRDAIVYQAYRQNGSKEYSGAVGDVPLMSRKASSPLDVGGSLKRARWQELPVCMTIVCMSFTAAGTPLEHIAAQPAPTKMDILGHVPENA
jgi:hypothetical protein